jgi:hypothetical protein
MNVSSSVNFLHGYAPDILKLVEWNKWSRVFIPFFGYFKTELNELYFLLHVYPYIQIRIISFSKTLLSRLKMTFL